MGPTTGRCAAPSPGAAWPAASLRRTARAAAALSLAVLAAQPQAARAQPPASPDTTTHARPAGYWRQVATGFAASLLAHESAHVVTALAVGAHPYFGLSKGRPTVYSGINARTDPHRQFLFSSMGLNVQAALDEGILDVPHGRGSPFERGVLAGGIATALFYVTVGRTASVSDIDYMARTSTLTKTQLTVIYGGIALLHSARMARDGRYADFFVRPAPERGLHVGVQVE